MLIAPVLANLGPLEELSFKPNPGEVQSLYFFFGLNGFDVSKLLEVLFLHIVEMCSVTNKVSS